jgi:hypothetical protein
LVIHNFQLAGEGRQIMRLVDHLPELDQARLKQ